MKKNLDHQTYEALIRRAQTCQPHGNFMLPGQVVDVEWARYLCEVVDFMEHVVRVTQVPFDVVALQGQPTMKSTNVGQSMLNLLQAERQFMDSHIRHYELDPRFELFVHQSDRRLLWSCTRMSMNLHGELGLLQFVDALNGGFHSMKQAMSSARFKNRIKAVSMKARQGYEELSDFFQQLVNRYPYAWEILMDFGYVAGHTLNNQCTAETDLLVTAHRKALEELLHQSLGEKLAGYAWRRDYGVGRGHQINLVLLVKEIPMHEQSAIMNQLGSGWSSSITQGGGVASARYAAPQQPSFDVWQTASRGSEPRLREALRLEAVAMELTQQLQHLKSSGPETLGGRHSRSLGC